VPDGFHVTTAAYRRFVDENTLQPRILETLQTVDPNQAATLEAASAQIGALFAAGRVPADVAAAIETVYADFANSQCPVAVRSSATAEDLPDASFAGQQETFLNVQGAAEVLEAVKRCWASLWTARAIGYRARQGIDHSVVSLAVVVQELVPADAAGILFTANPLNGSREEAVLNAAWGLGEAVVGGLMTPDTLTVDKATGRVLARDTADKQVMTARVAGGTEEQPVPEPLRRAPVLDDQAAAELVRLGVQVENLYAMPMDIEWTLADGAFAIVQARPITALPEKVAEIPTEWNLPDPKATYARGSLAEHTPSPVSPLFATLGLRIANSETYRLWEDITGTDPSGMFVGGGMYMVINSYVYAAFRLRLKETWMMIKMSFSQIGPLMRGSVERWQTARQILAGVVTDWEQKDITAFSPSELLDGARTVFRAAVKYYTVIQTTLPAASIAEAFFGRFYNGLVKRKNAPEFTTLLFGFETMPVRAEKSLFDIATWLKDKPALANYTLQTLTENLLADFKRETPPEGIPVDLWAEWQARLNEHFCQFGRTAYEFDFANPTPAEAPNPQFEAIKLFLEEKATSPYERHQTAVEKREQATQSILERLGWPRKGWFEKLLKWAQETGAIREDSIADMGLGHPLIRRMFAELGERFVAGGAIENADDIYWLKEQKVEDLVAALEKGQPLPIFVENIPMRKAEWRAALQITPPVALPQKPFILKFFGGEAEEKDGKIVLKGFGTSSGQVTAPACVLYGPQDFGKMKPGDVLIATTTTPAWTPLFTMASAVVTDIGGPLSHSSIVAREYGIPAVMAARNATRLIKSGQMITVDGAKGTVSWKASKG
jgi:pyruvate,water dikinase